MFNQIRKSDMFTWSYDKLICSAIFFVFHEKLRLVGDIPPSSWCQLITIIASVNSTIKNEICEFIEQNGYFYLNPEFAIAGARKYFDFHEETMSFFPLKNSNEQKEKLASILRLLQIQESQIQLLVSNAVQNQSFEPVINFLKNYRVEKPELLTRDELEVFLNQIDLSSSEKKEIIQDVSIELQTMKATDLLSTWDDLTVSSKVIIFNPYETLPERETIKLLNKKIFFIVNQLISTAAFLEKRGKPCKIILYPPLKIIKDRLLNLSLNDLRTLYELFYPKTDIPNDLMKQLAGGGLKVASGGLKVALLSGLIMGNFGLSPQTRFSTRQALQGESARVIQRVELGQQIEQIEEEASFKEETSAKKEMMPAALQEERPILLEVGRGPRGKGFVREQNLPINRQTERYLIKEKSFVKIKLDKVEFQARFTTQTDANTNKTTRFLTIYGTEDRFGLLKSESKRLLGIFDFDFVYNGQDCQLDHIVTKAQLKALGIHRDRAGAIAVLTPQNTSRTGGIALRMDLSRPASLTYKVILQDQLTLVDGLSPGIIKSFQRVANKEVDFPHSEENIQLILDQVPRAIDRLKADVYDLFSDPYKIPEEYEIMVFEARGITNSLISTATQIDWLLQIDASIGKFINQDVIESVEKRCQFVKGVTKYVNSISLSTTAGDFLESELNDATSSWKKILIKVSSMRRNGLEIAQRNVLDAHLVKCAFAFENDCSEWGIDNLEKMSRELQIDQHEGPRGCPLSRSFFWDSTESKVFLVDAQEYPFKSGTIELLDPQGKPLSSSNANQQDDPSKFLN